MRVLIFLLLLTGCQYEYETEPLEFGQLAWDYGDSQLYQYDDFYYLIVNGVFTSSPLVYADPYCLEPITPYFEQDFNGKYIVRLDGNNMYYTDGKTVSVSEYYVTNLGYCEFGSYTTIKDVYYIAFKTYRRKFL